MREDRHSANIRPPLPTFLKRNRMLRRRGSVSPHPAADQALRCSPCRSSSSLYMRRSRRMTFLPCSSIVTIFTQSSDRSRNRNLRRKLFEDLSQINIITSSMSATQRLCCCNSHAQPTVASCRNSCTLQSEIPVGLIYELQVELSLELQRHLPSRGLVLEVASGTGDTSRTSLGAIPVSCSSLAIQNPPLASIDAWSAALGLHNIRPAIALDAASEVWPLQSANVVLCINMIHIAPWAAAVRPRSRPDCGDPVSGSAVVS